MHYRLFRRRERKKRKKYTWEHYGGKLSNPKEENTSRYRKHMHAYSICATLCNPLDDSLPGFSSVHGISQSRILKWVAISHSSLSSWPGDRTCISCTGRQILYYCTTWEVQRVPKQNESKQTHTKTCNETGKSWREITKDNKRKSHIQWNPYKASPDCRIYAGQKGAA